MTTTFLGRVLINRDCAIRARSEKSGPGVNPQEAAGRGGGWQSESVPVLNMGPGF